MKNNDTYKLQLFSVCFISVKSSINFLYKLFKIALILYRDIAPDHQISFTCKATKGPQSVNCKDSNQTLGIHHQPVT